MKHIKGNQMIGIGLIMLSVILIINKLIDLTHPIYLLLMIIAIVIEVIGLIKIRKEEEEKKK